MPIYKARFTVEVTVKFTLSSDACYACKWIGDVNGDQSKYIARAIEKLDYPGNISARTIKTECLF